MMLAEIFLWLWSAQNCQGAQLVGVEFAGNQNTDEQFLRAVLSLPEGEPFEAAELDKAAQRLRNLRIFRNVTAEVKPNADGVIVKIHIEEKQTLLPFFRLRQGGGAQLLVFGVGDLNSFGRGIEFLPQYENLNGKWHGGRLNWKVPWPNGDQMDIWEGSMGAQTKIQRIYSSSGVISEYRKSTQDVSFGFSKGLAPYWTLGFTAGFAKTNLDGQQHSVPYYPMAVHMDIGVLDWYDYRSNGFLISPQIQSQLKKASHRFSLSAKGSKILPFGFDIASRLYFVSGAWDGKVPLDFECSLGGYAEVRGFLDDRVRGTSCWYGNVEGRHVSYQSNYFVFQPALFLDLGAASATAKPLQFQRGRDLASLGGGVRLIFPSLARLALRIDLAKPISGPNEHVYFATGSTQFF